MQIACGSIANPVRQKVNNSCADLSAPMESIVRESDKIKYQGKLYLLADRYKYSQTHIKTLSECIIDLACLQEVSDYEFECNKQRSLLREILWGNSSCDLKPPICAKNY